MQPKRRIFAMTLSALLLFAGSAAAQWPTSPAAPLIVADPTGAQVQSKIVATADGGFYLSWFDNSTGGYDVMLQRLDVEGNELWTHNGVLVADRGFSSTQDYGLDIDTAGNALLAFRDDRGRTTEITVVKVAPDGTLLWGPAGVAVSTGGSFVAAPKVTGTSDGQIVVAWTSDNDVIAQRLNAAGVAQWSSGITITAVAGSFSVADLHASDAGTAIVSFTHLTGGFPSPIQLWATKLAAADGAAIWGPGHVQVYDQAGGSLQIGNYPPFVTDGSGGAVFAWYTSSPTLQVRAQRILANGTEVFIHNGVEVSTNATRVRVSPTAAFDPTTSETFVAWREQTSNQSQSALYAQKIDAAGSRQWTDDGRELMPMSTDEITSITNLALGGGALLAWIHAPSFGNDPVYAIRVDGNGNFSWAPPIAEVCILPTHSSRLGVAMGAQAFAAYVWSDGGTSNGDIYAASLNPDGSLGYHAIIFRNDFETGDTGGWASVVP